MSTKDKIIKFFKKKIPSNSHQSLLDIYKKYYYECKKILENAHLSSSLDFELLPALYVVEDFTALSCHKDRVSISKEVLSEIDKLYKSFDKNLFDKRVNLYAEVIRGKNNLFLWNPTKNNEVEENDPVLKCVYLLCDILFDSKCADNYTEEYPVILADITYLMFFHMNVVVPLTKTLSQFFEEIYNA